MWAIDGCNKNMYIIMAGYPSTLQVIKEEFLKARNIFVVLEWNQENGVSYHVVTVPVEVTPKMVNIASVELTLHYNTHYNVGVIASLCGQNNVSNIMELHYGGYHSYLITHATNMPTHVHHVA